MAHEAFASGLLRGFGKLFRTFGGQQGPSEVDLGSLQPVVDVIDLGVYGASPGLDDGWWLGRVDIQLTGVGYQSTTWNPRNTPGSPVLLQADLVPWVYAVSLQATAVANLTDFSRARVTLTDYSNVMGSGAKAETPLGFFTSGSMYKSSDLVAEVIPEPFMSHGPDRVPEAGLIHVVAQNDGALGNVQYAFGILLRFLPPGVHAI